MCDGTSAPAAPARHMLATLEGRVGLEPAQTVKHILEMIAMDITDTAVERGSANVFAKLGLDDADAHLLKAGLVSCIDDIVSKRGITETAVARLLGLFQLDMSRLVRGDFREHSLQRLLRLLTSLACDIDIVIRQPQSASGGKLRIVAAEQV